MLWDDVFDESRDFYHEIETVKCETEEIFIDNQYGIPRPGVKAVCTKCGHEVQSFGRSEKSIKRCLAVMCEECPNDEDNWYEEE